MRSLFSQRAFDNQTRKLGYELELCLVDDKGQPCKVNHEVIEQARNPLLTTELAKFNLEINGHPFKVSTDVFDLIDTDLRDLYQQVERAAEKFEAQPCLFGVLPSVCRDHLNPNAYMSEQHRYDLLSRQLIKMRGKPVQLQLQGEDYLKIEKNDVMLEALGTSLPKILFLDEPTTGLDPQSRRNLWERVRRVKAEGTTILLTTHYMEEAYELCDEIAIMDHGRIIAHDAPDTLLAEHFDDVVVQIHQEDIPPQVGKAEFDATYRNGNAHIVTADVNRTIEKLLSLHIPLGRLRVRARDLEDLFLELTGKELRA